MQMLQGVWKQHLRPHAVVGYGVKILLPSPPNYVTRSPGICGRGVDCVASSIISFSNRRPCFERFRSGKGRKFML